MLYEGPVVDCRGISASGKGIAGQSLEIHWEANCDTAVSSKLRVLQRRAQDVRLGAR